MLNGRSSYDIGNELGLAACTIQRQLRRKGIHVRTFSEAKLGRRQPHDLVAKRTAKIIGRKTSAETRKKLSDVLTGRQKSEEHRKKLSELQRARTGPKAPNWRGGASYEPYCHKFNEELKERVRDSFGRMCYICKRTESKSGKRFCCHHIDYNKVQGCKGKQWALIPLCPSCHVKTNYNRWYWFCLLYTYWAINPETNLNNNF